MDEAKISAKTFLSEVEKVLKSCDKSALEKILFQMANNTPLGKRADFLEKLKPRPKKIIEATTNAALLNDIESFKHEYKSAIDKYNSGEHYYSDEYEYDEDGMRVEPYEDYYGALRDLFDKTAGTFESCNFVIAAKAYFQLFEILRMEDTYGSGIRAHDLDHFDVETEITRYARSVYEISKPTDRADLLFHLLRENCHAYGVCPKTIMLSDIMNILPDSLPKINDFLDEWLIFLQEKDGELADKWYREAVKLQGGENALAELAMNYGKVRPLVFLDWISCLTEGWDDEKIIQVAQEALRVLPVCIVERAVISDHFFSAAKRFKRNDLLETALKEALASCPSIKRLVDIFVECGLEGKNRLEEKSSALKNAECILQERFDKKVSYKSRFYENFPKTVEKKLLAQSHLLAGNWKAAKEIAGNEKSVLGWRHLENCQAIVVPAFFIIISRVQKGNFVAQLWKNAVSENFEDSNFDNDFTESDSANGKNTLNEYKENLTLAFTEMFSMLKLEKSVLNELLDWCQKIVDKRIEEILTNKHRGAYNRAGLLLLACGEAISALNGASEGTLFVNKKRKEYSRFAAFQKELKILEANKNSK